ncbi:MAG: 50S ribosomal protein L6 [Candidatus Nealsonbacteria bacterium CG08_land_8_20_14_0_20_38_20]|uniref:Large ribosomal subunit protein uL6 n=1 Tax=Candidatus Nealsonbacteria bacterium CG08_land_8_20_14_0_20_38_20 TaxID=1974705 RepID=A0A2H0YMY2_9BACT|nr:MAG: 50S ribosomal protein L6 [Candidatus Nealsonbacteria bacterium CG08_land_8_20_14_0_20_38_20]
MSRIGKKPILIPEGVEVKIEGQKVIIKGPKGELSRQIRPEICLEVKENKIFVAPQMESKKTKAFWGLTRSLIFNMVKGVKEEYEKKLEIEGLGYKASLEGKDLVLSVGFTNPVKIMAREGIKFSVEKNVIVVSGFDKELVGQLAAKIKKTRPPEPYKGKGIRYFKEVIRRKEGKKAATTTAG